MQKRLRKILCVVGLSLCLLPGCSSEKAKETEVISPNEQAEKTPEYFWVKDFSNAVVNDDEKEIKSVLGKELASQEDIDRQIQKLCDYVPDNIEYVDYSRLDQPQLNGEKQSIMLINFHTVDGIKYQVHVNYEKDDKDIVVQKIETYSPVEDGGTVGCDTAQQIQSFFILKNTQFCNFATMGNKQRKGWTRLENDVVAS